MERIEAMVPPPLYEDVDEHQEKCGFDNRSQTIRSLLRRGLESENQ
jgi:metal-responsive CopG/Arc/MetJ family transcriptional regulator